MKYPFLIIEKTKHENLYYLIVDEPTHKEAYLSILKNKLDNQYLCTDDEEYEEAKLAIKNKDYSAAYHIVEARSCGEYEDVEEVCFTNNN